MFDINQLAPNQGTVTATYLLTTLFMTMLFTFFLSFKTEVLRWIPVRSRELRACLAGALLWPVGLWATAKPPMPPGPGPKVVKLALRPGPFRTNTYYVVDAVVSNNAPGDIQK